MEYDLMKDQKICLFLIQILPVPDLCRLIIDYKNYLETQDNYIYHISLWENISSRFFISCETKFPTYSYILNGEHYIANKDRNLEYYNYTQISYQVRNMILQLIKAPDKKWRQGDDKMYGILSKKIMEKIKINSLI